MRSVIVPIVAATLSLCAHAAAQDDARAERRAHEEQAYCEEVEQQARAQAVLLTHPSLFANALTLQRAGDTGEGSGVVVSGGASGLYARFQAGVSFSPSSLALGRRVLSAARAECLRHRAERALEQLATPSLAEPRPVIEARLKTLQTALPEAESILDASEKRLQAALATAQDHHELTLRVDGLRRAVHAQRMLLTDAPVHIIVASDLTARVQQHRRAEQVLARAQSRVRRARAFDVSLRAGVDRILGIEQSVPLLAGVQISLHAGAIAQAFANAEAERAHARRVEARLEERMAASETTATRMAERLEQLHAREAEVSALLGTLTMELQELRFRGGESGTRLADFVWFDVIYLRAEQAGLATHVSALKEALHGFGTATP